MSKRVKTEVSNGDGPFVEIDLDSPTNRGELIYLADRLSNILDEIAELQEDAKAIREAVKSSGYTVKVFNQVLKEKRRGPEFQVDQLTMELELDVYRDALDLPRTLDQAQAACAVQAGTLPNREAAE